MTIRKACELYDEPRNWLSREGNAEICGRGINYRISTRFVRIGMNAEMIANCLRARIWYTPKSCSESIPIEQADTRTREPMQSSRRAGPGSRETQGLAEEERRIESGKAFGSGSSRCGQAPKGVGGMPWRHQKSERGRLRNAWGSCRTSVDPGILTKTQGTETSQYLVEKKSTETPSVVASERGRA